MVGFLLVVFGLTQIAGKSQVLGLKQTTSIHKGSISAQKFSKEEINNVTATNDTDVHQKYENIFHTIIAISVISTALILMFVVLVTVLCIKYCK